MACQNGLAVVIPLRYGILQIDRETIIMVYVVIPRI